MTIHSVMDKEMNNRRLFLPMAMRERFACSVGGHILNLANLDSVAGGDILFDEHGLPANQRNHLVIISPSGYGKSILTRNLLRSSDGILGENNLFPTAVRSTFSVESWMGTKDKNKEGDVVDTTGVFSRFKRGIVGADDYQPMKLFFEGEGLGHDEIYLMTALDTDTATKDLSYGSIEITGIGLTFWVGMRPTPIMLKSGLARRFLFQTYYPTREDCERLKEMDRDQGSTGLKVSTCDDMKIELKKAYDDIVNIGKVRLDYSEINEWLKTKDFPHFDEKIFRRAALGLNVSLGYYPDIPLVDEVLMLLEDEATTREQLRVSPFGFMISKILLGEQDYMMPLRDLKRFLMIYYQMTETEYKDVMSKVQFGKFVTFTTKNKVKYVKLETSRLTNLIGGP